MGSRVLNPSAQAGQEPYKRQQIRSEQHLREMEAILDRIAGLLHILAEEIVVFVISDNQNSRLTTIKIPGF